FHFPAGGLGRGEVDCSSSKSAATEVNVPSSASPTHVGWIDRGGYEIAHMEADPTHVGHRNKNARITDDVFGVLAGEKEGFTNKAEGEISYVPVADANQILGYLWWSDEENAAGFRPRPAAGP